MVRVDETQTFYHQEGYRCRIPKLKLGNKEAKAGQIIRIEQEQLTKHLDKVVKGTVEQTLNALLDAEADRLCQAGRYERTEGRRDTRAGHYKRKLKHKGW
jgi:transposase-like protein